MTTHPQTLAELTTLRVGGQIAHYVAARSETELIAAIAEADQAGTALLMLGGGSNIVAGDEGFDGVVVQDVRAEIVTDVDGPPARTLPDFAAAHPAATPATCGGLLVTVTAGTRWDDFVALAVEQGWSGIEALAGIPGTVGATPVQNVGAYGQEVSDTLARVRAWDRHRKQVITLTNAELAFGYRSSLLKRSGLTPSPRYIVLDVTFQLVPATLSRPIAYTQLAGALGVELGERVPLAAAREAVLQLRRSKGMVLDSSDHDTWSAGSFFTNPLLLADAVRRLPAQAPRFPAEGGATKTSAAWLISHAGFKPGWGLSQRATLSTKHVLALTNRGDASAADIAELAGAVRTGVHEAFGITLVPEPVPVGITL